MTYRLRQYYNPDASLDGFTVVVYHLNQADRWTSRALPPRTAVRPILNLSGLLSPAERNYWPTELEVACLVWAVRTTRHFIEDCRSPVVIYTGHSATC
jgi:hypothetical protein